MPSEKHNRLLEKVMESVRKEGYTVVRLDNRNIPDAFYINEEGKPIAIEIQTDQSIPYARCPEFFGILLVRKKYKKFYHNAETYSLVFKLRKEGLTIRQIQAEVKKRIGVHINLSSINDWLRGKSIPNNIVFSR